ncbi:MAG: ArsR/SmtB family transcription factor [Longimicrobiales bacterium]
MAQNTEPSCEDIVRVLGALSDENRFRIVELLATTDSELACGAIGSRLGLSPSLVSHHLAILETAGLIQRRKNGLWTLNRIRRKELSRHVGALAMLAGLPAASPPLA